MNLEEKIKAKSWTQDGTLQSKTVVLLEDALTICQEAIDEAKSTIILTTQQICDIANFAGFTITNPDDDDKDTEYTICESLEITIEDEDEKYKGYAVYCTEYPDEGALPLDNRIKTSKDLGLTKKELLGAEGGKIELSKENT